MADVIGGVWERKLVAAYVCIPRSDCLLALEEASQPEGSPVTVRRRRQRCVLLYSRAR